MNKVIEFGRRPLEDIYGEEDLIKVSLFSSGESWKNVLNNDTDLVSITLERDKTKETIDCISPNVLLSISKAIEIEILTNQECIFYYYCDEINPIPRKRDKNISVAEYRNKLFSCLSKRAIGNSNASGIVDKLIKITNSDGTGYIHLIYNKKKEKEAMLIQNYLKDMENK